LKGFGSKGYAQDSTAKLLFGLVSLCIYLLTELPHWLGVLRGSHGCSM